MDDRQTKELLYLLKLIAEGIAASVAAGNLNLLQGWVDRVEANLAAIRGPRPGEQ